MRTHSDWRIRQKIKQQGTIWVAKQKFWLFGTATFYDAEDIDDEKVTRDARHFFNLLDREALTRRDYNEGNRLQRLVFIEHGKTGTNAHFHFFIKGHTWQHYRQIYTQAAALWETKIQKSCNLIIKDNLASTSDRAGYCWKEYKDTNSDSLLLDCCHLNTSR